MLTKEDFHQNFRFISISCKLAAYPLQVDLTNGKLQLAQSKLRVIASWFSFSWYTLHVAYIVLRLPYLLLTGVQLPLLSILWHFTLVAATPIAIFWHYTAFFRFPGITVTCFNTIFQTRAGDETGKVIK